MRSAAMISPAIALASASWPCSSPWVRNTVLGDRQSLAEPLDELRPVGMAGIILEAADGGPHLDLFAMNFHRLRAVLEQAAERARRPGSRPAAPSRWACTEIVLEMMADAPRLAHAARRDDDVEAGEAGDRLALVDAFGRLAHRASASASQQSPRRCRSDLA